MLLVCTLFYLSKGCVLTSSIARSKFREARFCHVMHHASFNGALLAKSIWGLVEELTLDDNGMQRLHEEKELVLGTQGALLDTNNKIARANV